MKKICSFWLLAGVLLQDSVNFDNDLLCSNANITDELALYHLSTNPNCRALFQELPENVDELIEKYKKRSEDAELTEAEKISLEEAINAQEEFEKAEAEKAAMEEAEKLNSKEIVSEQDAAPIDEIVDAILEENKEDLPISKKKKQLI